MNSYDESLVTIFETAAEKAFTELIKKHGEEHFYYFAMMLDQCPWPYISAKSYEVLETYFQEHELDEDEQRWYKWSGAESPYEAYGWDEYFARYVDVLCEREQAARQCKNVHEAYCREIQLRIDSAEEAMRRLDAKGIFGKGSAREKVVVTVERLPSEKANYDRAVRLNQTGLIQAFLEENADLLEEE